MSLERLVSAARDAEPAWDDDRASRVLASALGRRERRASRDRALRRMAFAGSVVALVWLFVLRGASASSSPVDDASAAPVFAAHELGDGGYARD